MTPFVALHLRFAERARAMPDRLALRTDRERLSYGELLARSDALAARLVALGAGPEVAVALRVGRDASLAVGVHGILAAGATVVGLDGAVPVDRLRRIAADAGAPILVTTRREPVDALAVGRRVVLLDDLAGGGPGVFARPAVRPSQRAFIVYTSGATGGPKGVEIEHGALAARTERSPYVALGEGRTLGAVTALSWNPVAYELIAPLVVGGTIALADGDTMRDPRRLARFLDAHDVELVRAAPSVWGALVASGWGGRPELAIVSHGERLSGRLADALAVRGRVLLDTWGSTEASTMCAVERDGEARVVRDERLAVVRDDGAPTAVGELGAIAVGGPILARGYLGDPALTAARFPTIGGRRVHLPGELGRVRADGAIELCGRADGQVKVRGQRVEVAEIEAVLGGFASEVAVVARPDAAGEARLHAYLGAAADRVPIEALRAACAERLPAAMVPERFVWLDALPRTEHGKLDRRALPAPPRRRPLEAPAVSARDADEAWLARVFAEVLELDEVGVEDDFFDLGGHSLAAARVALRVEEARGRALPIATLFEARSVRRLAPHLGARGELGPRAIERATARDGAPLSFAQERLWFLAALGGTDAAYHVTMAERLDGPLDLAALRAALAWLVARHEVLRTALVAGPDGRPVQRVREVGLEVPLVALASVGEGARAVDDAAVRRVIAAHAAHPFDLARPPLLRAVVIRLAADRHVLALTLHHVASDGWSKAIVRRELALAYSALRAGAEPPLAALPIQVIDHAIWQRATLGEAALARQLAYWRDALRELAPLELPTDRPRPPVFSHRGARVERVLDAQLARDLGGLAHGAEASLFMVLLAAFDVLLARWSGQSDVAVGAPIAGRGHPECEGLVGFFVNTLVLRQAVDEDATFLALLAAVKARVLGALEHQDLPFERLVGELNPPRDPGRHPLVQVVLALQNTPWGEVAFDGLAHAPLALDELGTRFDLELHVWPRDGVLRCHLVYATDLFDEARAVALLDGFEALLRAAVAAPGRPIAELEASSEVEREALVARWNATAAPLPEVSVPAAVVARARRHPARTAVVDGAEVTTYGELVARAGALAARLRAAGVGEGARVGVALPRSRDLLVAELAAMGLGAAYVPLDPDYPRARLAAMVAAAELAVIVAADLRLADLGVPLVDLTGLSTADPLEPVPDDLDRVAYVISTSGSSGRPHAVAIHHRGLANTVAWYRAAHDLGPDDRVPWLGSPSFDASVLETWPTLVAGASLHVVERDARLVPARLLAWLARERITVAFLPTALVELLLDAPAARWPPTLRWLATGGDRLLRRPRADAPFRLHNLYGPTEVSVVATAARVLPDEAGPIAIGLPIANTRALVVDARGRLAPVGVSGELWLGGVGLAAAYLGEPELFARRFVAAPWGRFYRSGDRVRRRGDGALEFLGRVDRQVKIRGVRIEPGEVDAALADVPGVAESVTVAREDGRDDRRLVTYLVLADARDRAAEEAMVEAQVERWRALYDAEYGTIARSDLARRDGDPTFEIQGWNSSLTGRPIPAHEMRAWVDAALATIAPDRVRSVLEIGCGTGLLLFPLAPRCERYAASDLSFQAIAHVRRHLAPELAARVRLVERPAHDLAWLAPDERFDVAVLNSVVQYFPSADYLVAVLERVVPHVARGGRVVIGDVRNLDLAEAFHLAVARAHHAGDAGHDAAAEIWRERARDGAARDQELQLSPDFFRALASRLPRVARVAVAPKRGRARNELTMFRCEVVLTLDDAATVPAVDVPSLDAALASDAPAVRVAGLVDARLAESLAARRAIAQGWSPAAAPRAPVAAVDLEALAERVAATGRGGRGLALHLAPGSETVTAIITAPGVDPADVADPVPDLASALTARATASDPLGHERRARSLVAVRARLVERLPEVMMPAAFVFLEALPRAPTGKLDRLRLPPPTGARPLHLGAYTAPAGPLETIVADVFREALGFETVGRDDDFFALGGHSLLAVEVVTRLEARLAREVPLAALFSAPTVAGLAARLASTAAPAPVAGPEVVGARLPFTPMDVAFHYGRTFFGAGPHAWYQVMELELAHRLDRRRLALAIGHAVARHPLLRARPSHAAALGREAGWAIAPGPADPPLEVREVADADAMAAALEALIATPFAFGEGSPFRFVLLAGPARDTLVVRYHHAVVDGSGLACLARTVMSHYLGRPDPDARVRPWTPDELARHHAPDRARAPFVTNREVAHFASLLPAMVKRRLGVRAIRGLPVRPWPLSALRPAPLAGSGGDPADPRSERVEHALAPDSARRLDAVARRLRTTLDRLFLVGLVHAIAAWNAREARDLRRAEVYWAVNLRPASHFLDVVGNHFAWSRVSAPGPTIDDAWAREILDPASRELVRGAVDWLRTVDGFHHLEVPDLVRGAVMRALRRAGPTVCVTNTLPFGELETTTLGADFGLARVGFHSRFFFVDRPVVVIGRRQGALHLRLVYPRSGRDAASARRFLAFVESAALERLEAIVEDRSTASEDR